MVTSIEPKVAPTGRYTVKQTCECLGIHRNTLRRYTDEGHIKCSFRREMREKYIWEKKSSDFGTPSFKILHICNPNP